MSLPHSLADLLRARSYPHPCASIEVVETHISWVVLTGEYAYKLKKPVHFSFVDFSTLERRAHFCREELRCNRRFAPSLYLDVVPVGQLPSGELRVASSDTQAKVVEWAVKMRQFPFAAQLDRLLAEDALDAEHLEAFGRTLARQHSELPVHRGSAGELDERILAPARANFEEIARLGWAARAAALFDRARAGSEDQAARHREVFVRRLESGCIRECHGDLHLSNLVLLDGVVTAFDCLEFNPTLRWIDPLSDLAFLFMDCLVRQRADLGYACLDGYLDAGGDYDGVRLLPFYAGYRSMVRAKVAALRGEQAGHQEAQGLRERCLEHARWAADWLQRPAGRLVLMCGLSGSGKSWLAARLAPRLPGVRLRSDIARKNLAGLRPLDRGAEDVGSGLYRAETTAEVYRRLAELSEDLLRSGENVIVDATFLAREHRQAFQDLARRLGTQATILFCDAPRAVLESRLRSRSAAGADPSDADLRVLEHQSRDFVAPSQGAITVDTAEPVPDTAIDQLIRTLTL